MFPPGMSRPTTPAATLERDPADPARRHGQALVVALAPWIVGPFVALVDGRATIGGIATPACLFARWLPGVGCPGCGLTRSVALALHGELAASIALNPGGLLLLALGLAAAVLHAGAARRGYETERERRLRGLGRMALLVGLLLPWLARVVHLLPIAESQAR